MKNVLTCMLIICCATSAFAQEKADPVQLPGVTVTTTPAGWGEAPDLSDSLRADIPPNALPVVATAYDAALMKRQGSFDLKDTIKNSAGVTVGTTSGVHDLFIMRGIDSLNGGLILIDGLAEPEATTYPMYNIDQVQVMKGPGSFLHGANSTVGSVNLVRKKPINETFTHLRLGIGSHDDYRASIDQGLALTNVALRINALYRDAESHRDGIESELFGVNPAARITLSEHLSADVFFDYLYYETTPDAGLPVLGDRLIVDSESRTFNLPGDTSEQDSYRAGLTLSYDAAGDLTLRNRVYFNALDWDSRGTILASFPLFLGGMEAAPSTLGRLRGVLSDEQRIIGNELEFVKILETDNADHRIVGGLEYTRYTDKFQLDIQNDAALDLASGFEFPLPLPPIPSNVGDAETDLFGIYGYDHVNINEALAMMVGGRVDFYDFEDSAKNISNSETLFSPMGGFTLDTGDFITLFANASFGYTPPSTQSTNPSGDAEEGAQIEGGVKLSDPEGKWFGQLSVFQVERENISIPNTSGITRDEGSQESTGVELEGSCELASGLRLRLAYAYLDSELTEFREFQGPQVADFSGADAPFAPEHTAQLWAEYRMDSGLGAGLGLRALSEQFIAADNRFEIDSYATLDAALFYEQADYSVYLNLKNLTDEDYFTRGIGGSAVIPEDGIAAEAAVEIRL